MMNVSRSLNEQRGVVIIENMIAILIFSLGILGIVGLLAAMLKNTTEAKYRNDASLLANQIIGEMWISDKSNAGLKAAYESPNGAKYLTWRTAVANALPNVATNAPTITIDANNVALITLMWKLPGESAAHRYTVSARING
jgi:type IV pilus assembly protein PilV